MRQPRSVEIAVRMQAVDERVFAGTGRRSDGHVLPMRRGNRTMIVSKALAAGPGLTNCREIVQAHRGSIRACHNPGGGASRIVGRPRETPALR